MQVQQTSVTQQPDGRIVDNNTITHTHIGTKGVHKTHTHTQIQPHVVHIVCTANYNPYANNSAT